MVAAMLEALTLEGKGCVLEVGTGYGFQTGLIALLVEIARSRLDAFNAFMRGDMTSEEVADMTDPQRVALP
jgi:protein-L-isoaspartate O-methyltransferase